MHNKREIGQVFKHWPKKTILESDNNLFSLITMNHNPLHIAEDPTVIGLLVISLAAGMSVSDITVGAKAVLSYEKIIHHKMVKIGDTINAESLILDKKITKTGKSIIDVETSVFNQKGEKVLSFERSIMF